MNSLKAAPTFSANRENTIEARQTESRGSAAGAELEGGAVSAAGAVRRGDSRRSQALKETVLFLSDSSQSRSVHPPCRSGFASSASLATGRCLRLLGFLLRLLLRLLPSRELYLRARRGSPWFSTLESSSSAAAPGDSSQGRTARSRTDGALPRSISSAVTGGLV